MEYMAKQGTLISFKEAWLFMKTPEYQVLLAVGDDPTDLAPPEPKVAAPPPRDKEPKS